MAREPKSPKQVETLTHDEVSRRNIPTAEFQSMAEHLEERTPRQPAHYPRARPLAPGERRDRDEDLDPQVIWNGMRIRLTDAQRQQLAESGEVEIGDAQLVWRGKDTQDWSDLIVQTPPLYIQEKIHPKVIVDDLKRRSEKGRGAAASLDLFADFNGLDPEARTEFYQHDQHWSNRMILGDSLSVMASLAQREALAGKVQCIFFDPPYGIKFNSNWQVSTQSRDVKDGKQADISREPEQVKAFRDTWKDGIHSYLTYLRDRLTVMRELLTADGSIFVQIGDENLHRVRAVLDEIFGENSFVSLIAFTKGATGLSASGRLAARLDYIIWYSRSDIGEPKYRQLYELKGMDGDANFPWVIEESGHRRRINADDDASSFETGIRFGQDVSLSKPGPGAKYEVEFEGRPFTSGSRWWGTTKPQLERVIKSGRIIRIGNSLRHLRMLDESGITALGNLWAGFLGQSSPVYVVQTNTDIVQRCVLMATDPGDLVVDPTCGSGTTAFVAEQWGRRWITVDTSRVALALARTRLMGARYPYYLLADSSEGRRREQEVSGKAQSLSKTQGDIRHGFVYERAPHVTLRSIANNAEIDVIYEQWQLRIESFHQRLNGLLGNSWHEWEIPRDVESGWPEEAKAIHREWSGTRRRLLKEMDASIARRADVELLFDRPYYDTNRVRVAGPFTVESLSPHRISCSDSDELVDDVAAASGRRRRNLASAPPADFTAIVLENLKTAGVQQSTRAEKIVFTALTPWPGEYIAAEGRFMEGDIERRAGIFIGPEFGTTSRPDLMAAAREATDARFDVLVACAFNFEAHASDLTRLGPMPVLKAKINPDMHMAGELKNTGKGNLFIVFGEPDVEIEALPDDQIQVRVKGVDVFDPNTGDIRSGDTKSIAAWFIDTDYDEESFFVRHAYFLGAGDPYKSLKTALRAEIDEAAWATLYREVSRPFDRPRQGRIAVKVINHFGDEVMKVYRV